ncbi:MAG TPA: helix-turn-helix domain-containing protein [Phycisphaerae bacterium]|nr:helix-turn-helix domain-containing protein [Phycisphaerae bacterium]
MNGQPANLATGIDGNVANADPLLDATGAARYLGCGASGNDTAAALTVQLLTPRQAAKALAISERTLWKFTKRGEVPVVRIGRAVRYDQADLQAWIQRRKAGRAAETTDAT